MKTKEDIDKAITALKAVALLDPDGATKNLVLCTLLSALLWVRGEPNEALDLVIKLGAATDQISKLLIKDEPCPEV